MKRRLRKKRHSGEFAEWGRQLVVIRNRKDGLDEFLDRFVAEAVEANGCCCGGGGKEDTLDIVIELGRRSDDPDGRLSRITAWLDAQAEVKEWKAGEEFDLWNDDFIDSEETVKCSQPARGRASAGETPGGPLNATFDT